jgi:hypothetical protein
MYSSLYFVMGDFAPFDAVETGDAVAGTAGRGGGVRTLVSPRIAAACVAAVPLGGSGSAAGAAGCGEILMGGPVDACKGSTGPEASSVALGARRQRLNIPNIRFPACYWLRMAMLAEAA